MKRLEGVITAMVTNFKSDGALDVRAMQASVRFQIENGAAGLCPLGGTGEPLAMTVTEHKQVIDAVTGVRGSACFRVQARGQLSRDELGAGGRGTGPRRPGAATLAALAVSIRPRSRSNGRLLPLHAPAAPESG